MNERKEIQIEQTYTTQEVADTLGIGRSTLNKYSRSLESSGYTFLKDELNRRAYLEKDFEALKELKHLLDKKTEYDSAINAVASKYKEEKNSQIASVATPDPGRYEEIDKKLDTLIGLNEKLTERLDRMEKREQERNENLTLMLRNQLETRKLLAAAQEEKKEKKWWEFFRK